MDRPPLGLEPTMRREFNIGDTFAYVPPKQSLAERLKEFWHYLKNFSFNRGETLELDVDDDIMEFLERERWIKQRRGKWYMTKRGSDYLVAFARDEIERIKSKCDDAP